jgi:hypothetical protein
MRFKDQSTEQLNRLVAFYDTDKLRAHYTTLLAELRLELERRAMRGNPNRTLFLNLGTPERDNDE